MLFILLSVYSWKHVLKKKEEIIDMRNIKIRRLISTVLVTLMLLTMANFTPASANSYSNENFYSQSAQLITENWSDDYFGSIILEIGESTMLIDGEEKEIDSDGATPVIIDSTIMLPVEVITSELGADPFWDELDNEVTIEEDDGASEQDDDASEQDISSSSADVNDDTVMLPLCVVAENLNLEFEWDSKTGRITLTRDFQTKRIIAKTKGSVSFSNLGAETIIGGRDGIYVLQFDSIEDAQEAHGILEGMSSVIYVEPDIYVPFLENEIASADVVADSAHKSWGVEKIGADKYAAHLIASNKTTQITVAVLDTGVDSNHTFLNGRVRNDGSNTISGGTNTSDIHGHGTHVAGTIVDSTPGF